MKDTLIWLHEKTFRPWMSAALTFVEIGTILLIGLLWILTKP